MGEVAINLVLITSFPFVVFLGGVWIISHMSGFKYVTHRLQQTAATEDQNPLDKRLGYNVGAVQRHWNALDAVALSAEQRFLEIDLVFPFFYGSALVTSLLKVWAMLGWQINPAFLISLVAVTVLADWTENLVQLAQLRRYVKFGTAALQGGWIAIASTATVLKLVFGAVSFVLLVLAPVVFLFH